MGTVMGEILADKELQKVTDAACAGYFFGLCNRRNRQVQKTDVCKHTGGCMKYQWELTEEEFGPFYPFVRDRNVTDIDYNGKNLWISDLRRGRYRVNLPVNEEFLEEFTHRIANRVNKPFNKTNNVLEAETDALRISIVHESVAVSGRSICIRKSMPKVRHTVESMLDSGYCTIEILSLLINCVKAKMNFAFCGEPGVGKTECAKFFSRFIPPNQRAITIEDNLEMHFHEINPENDCVELQVSKDLSYTDAIKLCLRQNPKWIILSEARSTEVQYLLEQWSTGVYGFTTLHLDDLRNLPDRIMNMIGRSRDADRLENYIYEFISVGVLIRQHENEHGLLERYIDQMCFYDRYEGKNDIYMLLDEGRLVSRMIPGDILKRMMRAGIADPFQCEETLPYEPLPMEYLQIMADIEGRA